MLREWRSLAWLHQTERIEVREVARQTGFDLRLHFIGGTHGEGRILDDERPAGKRDRLVNRLHARAIERIVMMRAVPPLTVIAVRDVKLRACVARRRIRARKRGARFDELIVLKIT